MITAILFKEFKPRGGSSPMTRFLLGMIVMVGALMFLGCPLRMMLRVGGGDLNAVIGLVGFVAGIFVGTLWLRGGFTLKRAYAQSLTEGSIVPFLAVAILVLSLKIPALFAFSESGPGAAHAPVFISLVVGLVIGGFASARASAPRRRAATRSYSRIGHGLGIFGGHRHHDRWESDPWQIPSFVCGSAGCAYGRALELPRHGAGRLGKRAPRRLPA
jgi:hypothetical protein